MVEMCEETTARQTAAERLNWSVPTDRAAECARVSETTAPDAAEHRGDDSKFHASCRGCTLGRSAVRHFCLFVEPASCPTVADAVDRLQNDGGYMGYDSNLFSAVSGASGVSP